jgi:hypothetical protein
MNPSDQIDTLIETMEEHAKTARWDRVLYCAEQIIIIARQNYLPSAPFLRRILNSGGVYDKKDEEYLPASQRRQRRAKDKTPGGL